MRKKMFLSACAIVFLVIGGIACRRAQKQDGIRIGAILSLTGRGSQYGKASLQGIQIAVDEVNKAGGIQGRKIDLVVEDSLSEAKNAVTAYQKLLDVDKVCAVIGPILSDEVLAVAPEANRRQVLILAPAAGTDKIATAGPWVFRNRESANLQSIAVAKLLLKQPQPPRLGILYSTTANAISYKDALLEALGQEKDLAVIQESFAEGQTDFKTILIKVKVASPSYVFVAGLAPEIARVLVQAREIDLKTKWLSTAGAYDQKLLEIAGASAEGLVFGLPALDISNLASPAGKLDAKLRKQFNSSIDMFSANAYDAIHLIAKAAMASGLEPDLIRSGLLKIKDFPGAGGTTTFVNPGTVIKPIVLMIVHEGKFSALYPPPKDHK
ncbi:MAG: ABC transporter substrate-binding protein [Acidobacteria bacterium]|nr:ABC transporter substrate-binding protein [Acidobacteriota bacterium]